MLKTAEAVSIGHPDKTADYISSYILDRLIEQDPGIHYAVEVMIKDIRFLKNLSKIDEFRSIIDLTHFTFIELHGGGNIDLWIKANYLSGTNIKCLYFRDRDTSTTPPSVVHPQKVIITSKREIENYIPISSIEEKFDVTFTPYEIEHWNDMDVANSLYNKGIRFGNDQKHSENVIKQILQGQNIWNQIILSPENRSEIQDWFQQMKDFFEDAGW